MRAKIPQIGILPNNRGSIFSGLYINGREDNATTEKVSYQSCPRHLSAAHAFKRIAAVFLPISPIDIHTINYSGIGSLSALSVPHSHVFTAFTSPIISSKAALCLH